MSQKFKGFIATLGIIALLLTTMSTVCLADRGESEYRRDSDKSRGYENRDWHDRRDRRGWDGARDDDRDDDRDEDRDDDRDGAPNVPTPVPPVVDPAPPVTEPAPPVVEPTPPVVEPTPPVVEPEPPVVEPTPPVVEPEPPVVEPTPPALDGAALYDQNCSGCHGQANKGQNVPSNHLGSRVNLTPEEVNAINSL